MADAASEADERKEARKASKASKSSKTTQGSSRPQSREAGSRRATMTVVKGPTSGLDMYPDEKLFVIKEAEFPEPSEHARRFVRAKVRLCYRGSRWLLQVDNLKFKNPQKYVLFFYLTTKNTSHHKKINDFCAQLLYPSSPEGAVDKIPTAVRHQTIEVGLVDTAGMDPRDFRCLFVAKPAKCKPTTPLRITFSEILMDDVREVWVGHPDVETRLVEVKEWAAELKKNLKKESQIKDMSYYRMKDPAKLLFEMLGRNRYESITFNDFKKLFHSLDIYMSEELMYQIFRESDPENDGLIDTLEMQYTLYLSTVFPKKSEATLTDYFFLFDDRDGQHTKRIDKQAGYIIARATIRDDIDELEWQELWDAVDVKRPREHTLSYDQFLKVWISATDPAVELARRGVTPAIKGRKKTRHKANLARLTELLLEEDQKQKDDIGQACRAALVERRKNRLTLDKKRWDKKKLEAAAKRKEREQAARAYREMLEKKHKEEDERKERKKRERRLQKKKRKQLEKRDTAKTRRHREKVDWNKKIEAHKVAALELDRLDLSGKELDILSPALYKGVEAQRNLGRLVLLDLSHNLLRTIPGPNMIYWMAALEKLDIRHNRFTDLPTELPSLGNLLILNASANRFAELTPRVGQLTRLKHLDMSRNILEFLPDEIADMTQLRSLIINHNHIKALPAGVGRNTSLTNLQLQNNDLHRLPEDLNDMVSLRALNAAENRLEYLPPKLVGLTSLRRLDLTTNRIHALPPTVGSWTLLEQCNLSKNLLRYLPDEVCSWHSVLRLDISRNQLRGLPKMIGNMSQALDVTMHHNAINAIPASMGLMKELQVLDLSHNRIPKLPVEFGGLGNLRRLDLSHNHLGEGGVPPLPPSMGTLFSLEWLDLSHNQVSGLVAQLASVHQLEYLNISHNRFEELPALINRLTKLKSLDCSFNLLTEYPVSLCAMTHLVSLDISGNKIVDLPHQLNGLTGMRHFLARCNRLRSLPMTLTDIFGNFITFSVDRNPLRELPDKFVFEAAPMNEIFGTHFVPKTKTEVVRQLIREEDEEEAAQRALRRASVVQRADQVRGRRRSSLTLTFALPGDGGAASSAAGLAGAGGGAGAGGTTMGGEPESKWVSRADEARYAHKSLSVDPRPDLRSGITVNPLISHGYERERRKELDEADAKVWQMWRGEEEKPGERHYYLEGEQRGYSSVDVVAWMKVHRLFYDAARAEWNETGWQHHAGKNLLINFINALRRRLGDVWDDALIPEVQKLYFRSKHLGTIPEYEQLEDSRIAWRQEQERQGNNMRTGRVAEAVKAHHARMHRFATNYSFDANKAMQKAEYKRKLKIKRDHAEAVENTKQLKSLMRTLDLRQRRWITEVNKKKDFQARLKMWQLQKFILDRSTFLNARAAENYVPPPDPDLRLIDSDIAKKPWKTL